MIASGAADNAVKIHDIQVGKTIQNFSCHLNRVKRLDVSKKSPFLIWSAGEDGTIR